MIARLLFVALLLGHIVPAWAAEQAGQVLFVAGTVTAERTDTIELKKNAAIYEQDIIATAARSRGQLLMRDGAKFALRPETRFVVKEYFLAGDQRTQPDGSVVVASDDSAVTGLIKGGFRTITGAIGRDNPDDYVVDTPAATMGIRGTHYTVVWCAGDCQLPPGTEKTEPILDGLYIGVTEGIVYVKNSTGEYTLRAGQFAYVKDRNSRLVLLPDMPVVLIDTYATDESQQTEAAREVAETIAALGQKPAGDGSFSASVPRPTAPGPGQPGVAGGAPGDDTADTSGDDAGSDSGNDSGNDSGGTPGDDSSGADFEPGSSNDSSNHGFEAEPDIPVLAIDGTNLTDGKLPTSRPVAMASGSIAGISLSAFTASSRTGIRTFAGNDLTAFEAPPGSLGSDTTYAIGTASILDDGFDPVTGIGWGRWSGGMASITLPDGSVVGADLSAQSLHWAYAPEPGASVALPITGTANYTLIAGNTDPTDTLGNSGVLGSASLLANFTTATVTSELLLGIGGMEWQASGSGTITTNLFNGLYNSLFIGGRAGGSGNFSGFFGTPGADGVPGGAGLTYGLTDGQGVSVSGAVVFGQPTP